MDDVAIIGVGLHPFGRFGSKSAIDMGAEAIRTALGDAGVQWTDIQFAFGGSFEVDNPDAVTGRLGLTGIPFMDVYNGCATAASALELTADAIRSGQYDIGVAVGMDKHEPGAFTSDPVDYGAPAWYGEIGHFLTTKFFAMKINRYMHDHGISHETLAKVAAKGVRQRRDQPQRVPAQADRPPRTSSRRGCSTTRSPSTCSARPTRAPPPWSCAGPTWPRGTRRRPIYLRAIDAADPTLRSVRGARVLGGGRAGRAPTVYASRAAYELAGIGPEDVDVIQLQDTDAGAEVIHMAENGFCADGEQEKLIAEGATEIGGTLPVNTDGGLIANGEPIGASGLRQVHELVHQLRGTAGDRQVPGTPEGRLRPAVRRARHRRRVDPVDLTNWSTREGRPPFCPAERWPGQPFCRTKRGFRCLGPVRRPEQQATDGVLEPSSASFVGPPVVAGELSVGLVRGERRDHLTGLVRGNVVT